MLITMAHHDRSIRECVEKGGLYASTVEELHGVPMSAAREWLQKYRRNGQVRRRKGTGLWRVSSPALDAALVAETDRISFLSARNLKAATGFSGQKDTIISRLKAAGLRARSAAVKELLIDQHKLYRLAFAESNGDRKWNRAIFTDESIFTSANDGPVLVYRPQESITIHSICLPANVVVVCLCTVCSWISHEGVGVLHHIEGHLEGLQYQHIL
jgi:hypothetical protein